MENCLYCSNCALWLHGVLPADNQHATTQPKRRQANTPLSGHCDELPVALLDDRELLPWTKGVQCYRRHAAGGLQARCDFASIILESTFGLMCRWCHWRSILVNECVCEDQALLHGAIQPVPCGCCCHR